MYIYKNIWIIFCNTLLFTVKEYVSKYKNIFLSWDTVSYTETTLYIYSAMKK